MRKKRRGRLKFGKKQLQLLLSDRPAMSKYVTIGDGLSKRIIHLFAGETCNHLVTWKPDDDPDDLPTYYGGHRFDPASGICYIHIRAQNEHGELSMAS